MRAWVGELDRAAATQAVYKIRSGWPLAYYRRMTHAEAAAAVVDAALSSMTQIEVTQIHGGFTDTDEHEYTQWISEWSRGETNDQESN